MSDYRNLILDVETLPLEGYFWRLFDENIGINQIKGHGGLLSWAASWEGSDETLFCSLHEHGRTAMVREMWELLNEADSVTGWNSNRFDIPHINTEFLKAGLGPPSPYKKVDLFRTTKSVFRLPSNKLDYFAQTLGIGEKVEHEGFPLWVACMKGDKDAWEKMEEYNRHDVILTAEALEKLRPWINTGVNRSALADDHVCPNCGSTHLQRRGSTRTLQLSYARWQCQDCGTWSRSVQAEHKSDRSKRLVLAR